MMASIQVAMVIIFVSAIVAIFSKKFDDGTVGKIALSCIALCSYFGFVNLSHGIMPEESISIIILASFSLVVRQYWIDIFTHLKPRIIILIKHERAKMMSRGNK